MRVFLSAAVAATVMFPVLAHAFTLKSDDVAEGARLADAQVADVFGCKGGNVSPQLAWEGAPEGTKSFVVTAYDPDAPTGSGFWHWVVANLPATTTGLPRGAGSRGGALPKGAVAAANDAGAAGFVGACPPPGKMHRYVFTVYALKVDRLDVNERSSGALVGFMTKANSLGEAAITAVYGQ
jgi:Raf kinase inhibitor-like YbhB/YbcL family protein